MTGERPRSVHDPVFAVLNALGCGALLLDSNGRVLETNERARRYLGAELDLRKRGAPVARQVTDGAMQKALRAALRASAEVAPRIGQYIVVPRAESRPLILRTIFLGDSDGGEDAVTAALIVLDMDDSLQPDEELLREVFMLTAAEIRLACGLVRGRNLVEIAGGLGLTLGTVRVQLKGLFLKTGTRRQGELIALLAHLTRLNAQSPL